MSEGNKAIARRFFEEGANERNLGIIDEIFTTTFVYHTSAYPEIRGPEELKAFFTEHFRPFPDAHYTIEEVVAEGDKVITRWTFAATHQGELMGAAPKGKAVEVQGISIFDITNGKISEVRTVWDALGLMQQAGVILLPEES